MCLSPLDPGSVLRKTLYRRRRVGRSVCGSLRDGRGRCEPGHPLIATHRQTSISGCSDRCGSMGRLPGRPMGRSMRLSGPLSGLLDAMIAGVIAGTQWAAWRDDCRGDRRDSVGCATRWSMRFDGTGWISTPIDTCQI